MPFNIKASRSGGRVHFLWMLALKLALKNRKSRNNWCEIKPVQADYKPLLNSLILLTAALMSSADPGPAKISFLT